MRWLDQILVHSTSRADAVLVANICQIGGVSERSAKRVLTLVKSGRVVALGRDLAALQAEILALRITGLEPTRAGLIGHYLANVASAIGVRQRQLGLGVTRATWRYPNAPCVPYRGPSSEADLARDAAHRAANGKIYNVATGLKIQGWHTYPGMEPWCGCVSSPHIPGLS